MNITLTDQQLKLVLQTWKDDHAIIKDSTALIPRINYLDKEGKLFIVAIDKDEAAALTDHIGSIKQDVSFAVLNNVGLIVLNNESKRCLISKIYYDGAIACVKVLLAEESYDFSKETFDSVITMEAAEAQTTLSYIFDSPFSNVRVTTYAIPDQMKSIMELVYNAKTDEDWEKFKNNLEGYDVNTQSGDGETVLHRLVNRAPLPVIEYVLQKGANPNIANHRYGRIPAFYAEKADVHKLLIKYGSNVNHLDQGGWTPAHYQMYKVDILKANLEAGLDLTLKSVNGRSIVFEAIEKNQANLVEYFDLLKENGAKFDDPDNWGFAPLHLAILYNNHEAIEYLLKEGNSSQCKTTKHMSLTAIGPTVELPEGSTARDLLLKIKETREKYSGVENYEWLEMEDAYFNKTCRMILDGLTLADFKREEDEKMRLENEHYQKENDEYLKKMQQSMHTEALQNHAKQYNEKTGRDFHQDYKAITRKVKVTQKMIFFSFLLFIGGIIFVIISFFTNISTWLALGIAAYLFIQLRWLLRLQKKNFAAAEPLGLVRVKRGEKNIS